MRNSYLWQLYITAHTVLFGAPFLFCPNLILPWLGFAPTEEPWIRVAGILFLVIGATSLTVFRKKIKEMLLPSINVRVIVVACLLVLGFKSNSAFIFVLAAIVFVGVAGSAVSYYLEETPWQARKQG